RAHLGYMLQSVTLWRVTLTTPPNSENWKGKSSPSSGAPAPSPPSASAKNWTARSRTPLSAPSCVVSKKKATLHTPSRIAPTSIDQQSQGRRSLAAQSNALSIGSAMAPLKPCSSAWSTPRSSTALNSSASLRVSQKCKSKRESRKRRPNELLFIAGSCPSFCSARTSRLGWSAHLRREKRSRAESSVGTRARLRPWHAAAATLCGGALERLARERPHRHPRRPTDSARGVAGAHQNLATTQTTLCGCSCCPS